MTPTELSALLASIRIVKIGILGDFCLDVYLLLDPSASEVSVETGLATRAVRTQRYTLGGAGNVASNLHAMGVGRLSVFGVIGRDPFGSEMQRMLEDYGADCEGLAVQRESWDTHVYTKPCEHEHEQHRIDFGNFNQLQPTTARFLLEQLERKLPDLDLVIVNQQVVRGIHTKEFRKSLEELMLRHPDRRFIVDSRHYPDEYGVAMRKVNLFEASKLSRSQGTAPESADGHAVELLALELFERWEKPLFLTRGEHGCCVCDASGVSEIPGLVILSPVDPVGAGDSMLAGIAAGMAAGAEPYVAAELGNLVAGVTVQKLMVTGTASPEEILALGADPDFCYNPDLARQPRKAVYHPETAIEIATALPRGRRFTHVIFDHDGTISTLRQGWEGIMEPMMIRAILGGRIQDVDEALYEEVQTAATEFIDKTTGIQTLVQMKGLINLVRRFRCVPEDAILDEFGYKKVYNDELLGMVNERIRQVQTGELGVEDFTMKKAPELLRALAAKGVVLYLASGTDQDDVVREAAILGYSGLFEKRIYGAVGDVTKEAKRIVLERIMHDIGQDAHQRILTFGDGPVEIRETHKRGGYTVGVASNEIRRHGWEMRKRRRVIEAGADLVVPDFCQLDALMKVLFP
jgi:bifunctional ADP-heptose synthase (sugar kinase/adenylyltransferase)/phosphoglycolate phosphatase-like HAD superfamily hydrolase